MKIITNLGALFLVLAHSAGAQDAPSHVEQIVEANSLDSKGKAPFHLKISFQLYDLEGKPTDTGTVEEWWAAPGMQKTLITAQSLNSAAAVPFDSDLKLDPRESYLLHRLLSAEVHPFGEIAASNGDLAKESERSFGNVKLKCLTVAKYDPSGSGQPPASFCVNPNDNALRIQFEGNISTTVRNGLGSFHETSVSLNLSIAFEERLAITGKVTTLQSFDPAKSEVVFPPSPVFESSKSIAVAGVTRGKILNKVNPEYPSFAKATHLSGAVIFHGVISKQGKVTNLFPIASPSPILTGAAMDAVKQWTYSPYLLNGEPTEVDTEIQVNFNFGGS